MIKIIECPRDAMQGLKEFIPTSNKVDYINSLLKVGFDTLDFGSFVSPKAIPQLSDTREVLKQLDLSSTSTKLLAIIGNIRGAKDALEYNEISYLGFPFSVSKTFLNLNIKSTYEQALNDIGIIQQMASTKNKEVVVYLSMAFGNPYGDITTDQLLLESINHLSKIGIKIINLSDTVGIGKASHVGVIFSKVMEAYPQIEFGLHLHTSADSYYEKIDEAYKNGCKRFDSVMLGLGGCPMSAQDLIGNLSTENLLNYFSQKGIHIPINNDNYIISRNKANLLFQ